MSLWQCTSCGELTGPDPMNSQHCPKCGSPTKFFEGFHTRIGPSVASVKMVIQGYVPASDLEAALARAEAAEDRGRALQQQIDETELPRLLQAAIFESTAKELHDVQTRVAQALEIYDQFSGDGSSDEMAKVLRPLAPPEGDRT